MSDVLALRALTVNHPAEAFEAAVHRVAELGAENTRLLAALAPFAAACEAIPVAMPDNSPIVDPEAFLAADSITAADLRAARAALAKPAP